jgi:hypothetical protein
MVANDFVPLPRDSVVRHTGNGKVYRVEYFRTGDNGDGLYLVVGVDRVGEEWVARKDGRAVRNFPPSVLRPL